MLSTPLTARLLPKSLVAPGAPKKSSRVTLTSSSGTPVSSAKRKIDFSQDMEFMTMLSSHACPSAVFVKRGRY
jgi:hypothetical protein